MSNEILDEVYRARDLLWERAGGTMRGLGEFLRECRRRADAGEYAWDLLSPQSEAIAAEVRARLAKEELEGAVCVREEREGYGRAEAQGHGGEREAVETIGSDG